MNRRRMRQDGDRRAAGNGRSDALGNDGKGREHNTGDTDTGDTENDGVGSLGLGEGSQGAVNRWWQINAYAHPPPKSQ